MLIGTQSADSEETVIVTRGGIAINEVGHPDPGGKMAVSRGGTVIGETNKPSDAVSLSAIILQQVGSATVGQEVIALLLSVFIIGVSILVIERRGYGLERVMVKG